MAAVERASGGLRIWWERKLQSVLTNKLTEFRSSIAKDLKDVGFLDAAVAQGRRLARISAPLADKRKAVDAYMIPMFSDITDGVLESKSRTSLEYWLRVGQFRMFEYGSVTALQMLGYEATSRRVRDMQKLVEVKKAAGDVVFELTDQEVIFQLEHRVIVTGASTAMSLVDDVRRSVRDIIILGGGSTQDVANFLSSTSGFPSWKANQLARTETHQAYEFAQLNTYTRSGVKAHEWITVGDSRVRPEHADNEAAGPVLIGMPFPSGQLHPGDGPGSINCRCTTQPDLSDRNIVLEPWTGQGGGLKVEPVGGPPPKVVKPKPAPPKPAKVTPPKLVETPKPTIIETPKPIPRPPAPKPVEVPTSGGARRMSGAELQKELAALDKKEKLLHKQFKEIQWGNQGKINALYKVPNSDELTRALRQEIDDLAAALKEFKTANKAYVRSLVEIPKADRAKFQTQFSPRFAKNHEKAVNKSLANLEAVTHRNAIPNKTLEFDSATAFKPGERPSSYYSARNKTVHLYGKDTNAKTVAHEVAHWLEDMNPKYLKQATELLHSRTARSGLTELGRPYPPSEKYYPTLKGKPKWINNYMGKIYGDYSNPHATEILSMGVEMYATDPVKLAVRDPELFKLIAEMLGGGM